MSERERDRERGGGRERVEEEGGREEERGICIYTFKLYSL